MCYFFLITRDASDFSVTNLLESVHGKLQEKIPTLKYLSPENFQNLSFSLLIRRSSLLCYSRKIRPEKPYCSSEKKTVLAQYYSTENKSVTNLDMLYANYE